MKRESNIVQISEGIPYENTGFSWPFDTSLECIEGNGVKLTSFQRKYQQKVVSVLYSNSILVQPQNQLPRRKSFQTDSQTLPYENNLMWGQENNVYILESKSNFSQIL